MVSTTNIFHHQNQQNMKLFEVIFVVVVVINKWVFCGQFNALAMKYIDNGIRHLMQVEIWTNFKLHWITEESYQQVYAPRFNGMSMITFFFLPFIHLL